MSEVPKYEQQPSRFRVAVALAAGGVLGGVGGLIAGCTTDALMIRDGSSQITDVTPSTLSKKTNPNTTSTTTDTIVVETADNLTEDELRSRGYDRPALRIINTGEGHKAWPYGGIPGVLAGVVAGDIWVSRRRYPKRPKLHLPPGHNERRI